MRGLLVVIAVTVLVGCGGGGGTSEPESTATSMAEIATATQVATTSPATPTNTPVAEPSLTATQAATATELPEPSPTATEIVPTPVVMASPAADLPVAGQFGATIPVGDNPVAIAVGHGSIWVQNDIDGTVSRIDPATNAVVATIPIATPLDPAAPLEYTLVGERESGPDLAVDATSVWATKPEEQAVVQVDPQTNAVVATIALEADPMSIAVDGSSLWVALFGSSSVARIDTATGEIVATIPGVSSPAGIAATQDAIWVTNYWNNSVTRIDPATNQVVATISLNWPGAPVTGHQCGLCATEALVTADGVWISQWGANAVVRIDPATNRVTAVIPVGSNPRSLEADARGVWVGHMSTAGALLIDPATNQVVAGIPASEDPYQLTRIAPWENTLWATLLPNNEVARIDLQPE